MLATAARRGCVFGVVFGTLVICVELFLAETSGRPATADAGVSVIAVLLGAVWGGILGLLGGLAAGALLRHGAPWVVAALITWCALAAGWLVLNGAAWNIHFPPDRLTLDVFAGMAAIVAWQCRSLERAATNYAWTNAQ